MKRQYLHLSVYRCDQCQGPVVTASLAVRENEISKETDKHAASDGASLTDELAGADVQVCVRVPSPSSEPRIHDQEPNL
jgi:hypothetical protein